LSDRATRAAPVGAALLSRLCPTHGRYNLKTLFGGLCLLLVATQTTEAAKGEPTANTASTAEVWKAAGDRHATNPSRRAGSLVHRLEHKLDAAEKYRSVIRLFDRHRRLLRSPVHGPTAQKLLRRASRRLAHTTRNIAAIRRALARRKANAPPKEAICDVFGRRYCGQALSVSWCESKHSTAARNGQYLGLFQMGSSERRLYGHGATARKQAIAAHRYFVVSGRDWSPWSCKPSYAY
jgi:hypothetical protein